MPALSKSPQHAMPGRSEMPVAVLHYLAHTELGRSIREIAREVGRHASTISRQVRRFENRRDDPLIDGALQRLGERHFVQSAGSAPQQETVTMTMMAREGIQAETNSREDEFRRVLRRLAESGSVLAVAKDMERAVIVRDLPGGTTTRSAVVDREIAEAMALKDWISCQTTGRISRYTITQAGRAALKRLLCEEPAAGFAEAFTPFAAQHQELVDRVIPSTTGERGQKVKYNLSESPLSVLARRRDKGGQPFLSAELVAAGERLREDFELAQMGPRTTQNWEAFLTAGCQMRDGTGGGGIASGPTVARERVEAALKHLGPGLGDIVLRCCCYLEGMEACEKRMGWSARSGKVVLRIALQRLQRHYEEIHGKFGPMIG